MDLAQPQCELLELAAQDEKQRFRGFDRVLEIEGLAEYFRWTHEAQLPLRASGRALPQFTGRRAEALDEFAAREAGEFAEMADAPVTQDGHQLGRRVHFRHG